MARLPLLAHASPGDVVAWRQGRPVSRSRFLGDVAHLAAQLPAGGHLLNACSDRYHFAVGLAAGIVAGKVSLLPSTYTAPDAVQLTDGEPLPAGLPCVAYPAGETGPEVAEVPLIDAERLVAWVFTSGSTGVPLPHGKTWGPLVHNVRAEAERLGIAARPHHLLGTVPPQHMYGIESTVLVALQSGGAFHAGRPFFPADIAAALAELPHPRMLVTTPFHLRTLLDAGLELPPAELVLSATAPLSVELAAAAEARFGAPLLEIYGSTETGQVASRRTTTDAQWTLFPGIRLAEREGRTWASGGHVEAPVVLADLIDLVDDAHFTLRGRTGDLVNIAGKRSSLGFLQHQLHAVTGVEDGVFFLPEDERSDGITRLAALVVAPGLDAGSLLEALRSRIDPVFMPRPLIFVDALPRNATGKLPRETCLALLAEYRERGAGRR
jgi:acyl-coenzyme A synthetase/AMP-(fatty) acid ligase